MLRCSTNMADKTLKIHFHPLDDTSHEVPMELLMRFMDGIGRLVYLVSRRVMADSSIPILELSEFRREFQITCASPEPGSFVLPIGLRANKEEYKKFVPLIMGQLFALLLALNAGDKTDSVLSELDMEGKERLVNAICQISPERSDAWKVVFDLEAEKKSEVTFSPDFVDRASLLLNSTVDVDSDDGMTTVIGKISSIDMTARKIVLEIPKTSKKVECNFRKGTLRSILCEGSATGVQVAGHFVLDDAEDPVSCDGEVTIRALDLSPVAMSEFAYKGKICRFKEGTRLFHPQLDEEYGQLFLIKDDSLGVDVFAKTRLELVEMLNEQFAVNWEMYALADDSRLSPAAINLKRSLLDSIEEA